MMMLSGYIAIYYNVIISWAFFYFFSSFSWTLPWSSCDNAWNSEYCREDHDLDYDLDTDTVLTSNLSKSPSDEFYQ